MQQKKSEKVFCFWNNIIWISIVKLSLLRTGYFSSTTSVLTSSPKIWHVENGDFFQLNWLGSDQWIGLRWCDADFNIAWALLPCCLSKGSLKPGFLDIYLTTFSESVLSKLQNPWASTFFVKMFQISSRFQKCSKKSRKSFVFLRYLHLNWYR